MKKILYLLIATLLTSCTQYVPLTKQLIAEYHVTPSTLSKIQVYSSTEIVLRNGTQSNRAGIKNGKLVTESYTQFDDVVLRAHTPGIITGSLLGNFKVSFDRGDTSAFLIFGSGGSDYRVMADWKRSGEVLYNRRFYFLSSEQADCHLLVKVRSLKRMSNRVKTIKGNRL